ncbi:MAG TPA: hypothetical protein VGL81_06990 [Polyangiaceae bacterium]|jgi:hypothetical protein
MSVRGRTWMLAAVIASLGPLGACAPIQEERLYGPPRPEVSSRAEVTVEHRTNESGTAECRDVTRTAPMVRNVVIRRSFADDTQEHDGAVAMLLGGGIGTLVFARSQMQSCSGGACSAPTVAAAVTLGVAAIPLAFLAYNALAVQDRRVVERVPPEVRAGDWRSCSAPPHPGETEASPE